MDMHEGTGRKRTSLFFNRRLTRDLSFNLSGARTEAETRSNEVFGGLMLVLGRSRSGHFGYRNQNGSSTAAATFQKNPPLGKGFGYRLGADWKDGQNETGGDASLQFRGDTGIYSAAYRRAAGQSNYHLGASGGLAFMGGTLYPTRPITDGFALVKVGNFENVQVKFNNQEIGTTNSKGELLIPGLSSYYLNDLSIEDKDIPVNYEIKEIKKSIAVPYRGAEKVGFDLSRLQGFTGRLFIQEKGQRTEAEYWGLAIRIDDEAEELIIGKRGFFYLENVPAGELRVRLFMKEKECLFAMAIPESDEIMVDLGEVACAMD
jgi:outer membrane usher protein